MMLLGVAAVAQEAAPFVFPEGWFSLEPEGTAIVFMLRSYGGDTRFDVLDESGRVVDTVSLPERRTVLAQYRVAPGSYQVRFPDKDFRVKASGGLFAAMGAAFTHMKAAAGKDAAIAPDYSPVANYRADAMQQRIAPLAALGNTDLLPPKALETTTLEFRMSGGGATAQ